MMPPRATMKPYGMVRQKSCILAKPLAEAETTCAGGAERREGWRRGRKISLGGSAAQASSNASQLSRRETCLTSLNQQLQRRGLQAEVWKGPLRFTLLEEERQTDRVTGVRTL